MAEGVRCFIFCTDLSHITQPFFVNLYFQEKKNFFLTIVLICQLLDNLPLSNLVDMSEGI